MHMGQPIRVWAEYLLGTEHYPYFLTESCKRLAKKESICIMQLVVFLEGGVFMNSQIIIIAFHEKIFTVHALYSTNMLKPVD